MSNLKNEKEKTMEFKFRKNPYFFKVFNFEGENKMSKAFFKTHNNPQEVVNMKNFVHKIKFGTFKLGNVFASFSFGIFLFAMQSYFLRQNLGLTDRSFISD